MATHFDRVFEVMFPKLHLEDPQFDVYLRMDAIDELVLEIGKYFAENPDGSETGDELEIKNDINELKSMFADLYSQIISQIFDGEFAKLIGSYTEHPFVDESIRLDIDSKFISLVDAINTNVGNVLSSELHRCGLSEAK